MSKSVGDPDGRCGKQQSGGRPLLSGWHCLLANSKLCNGTFLKGDEPLLLNGSGERGAFPRPIAAGGVRPFGRLSSHASSRKSSYTSRSFHACGPGPRRWRTFESSRPLIMRRAFFFQRSHLLSRCEGRCRTTTSVPMLQARITCRK